MSGDWAGATTSTTDNFDFTGGDGGTRPNISGNVLCTSGDCDLTPGAPGSYFNVSAFSRLTGRGDIGNAPRSFYPAAEDRELEHLGVQEFLAWRRPSHPVPLGDVQRVQPGELVRPSTRPRSSTLRASRSTPISARRPPRATRESCKGQFGLHSDSEI